MLVVKTLLKQMFFFLKKRECVLKLNAKNRNTNNAKQSSYSVWKFFWLHVYSFIEKLIEATNCLHPTSCFYHAIKWSSTKFTIHLINLNSNERRGVLSFKLISAKCISSHHTFLSALLNQCFILYPTKMCWRSLPNTYKHNKAEHERRWWGWSSVGSSAIV